MGRIVLAVKGEDVRLQVGEGVAEEEVRLGDCCPGDGGQVVENQALGAAVAHLVPGEEGLVHGSHRLGKLEAVVLQFDRSSCSTIRRVCLLTLSFLYKKTRT
jgi:hypothetical protein